ncbi:phospho-N-acetylmuramoyl-pentapeptide-transferase [Cupriavidus necator]|uniref:DUF3261 domain-containing protein n=1 Tax=Cupriavidus TaxID=106589 RepID=UPI00032E0EC6|nr:MULTISPECIES: DUF3261 domain-containing protein [Cupriavidus]EON20107.1 Phospho-N-acetylmuramoyl-pentapeptide-transferase [Cupriavidus sp. GA3-3]KUE84954.1 phospho-N-acetylmuramoyl-pentapeptide-transferase [Cupriavidus necator]
MTRATLSALALAAAMAAGCAAPGSAPERTVPAAGATALLRLPPASLQRELKLQQHITVEFTVLGRTERRELLALLEADAAHTRLAAVGGGQVLARLDWDGTTLQVSRAPWAPAELQPERILSDLQLTLWPAAAVRAALPAGWSFDATPTLRQLRQGSETVAEIRYPDVVTTLFVQHRDGYRLTIRNLPAEANVNAGGSA